MPPKLSAIGKVSIFYIGLSVTLLFRFLVGNLYGILIAVFFAYHYSQIWFGVSPYNLNQLLTWFATQTDATKSAILGALVTTLGFLIAYATATASWKSQLFAARKLQAAEEFHDFFQECSWLVTDCDLYAKLLIESKEKMDAGIDKAESDFLIQLCIDRAASYIEKKDKLVALGIKVYSLQSKYSGLLISTFGAKSQFDGAVRSLQNIVEKVWIPIPYFNPMEADPVESFKAQISVEQCRSLREVVKDNYSLLNMSSGSVKGNLTAPVVGMNLWAMVHLFKERMGIAEMFGAESKDTHRES